jgi:hypothetical protein
MKGSLVVYEVRKLYKKVRAKKVKNEYVRGGPRRPSTQLWSLEILGVNGMRFLKLEAISIVNSCKVVQMFVE